MKHKIALLTAAVILVLSVLACGIPTTKVEPTLVPTPVSSPTPVPVTQPETTNELAITDTYSFTDSGGAYYIVGNILNGTNSAVAGIEVTVEVLDASGISVFTDDSGNVLASQTTSPLLYTLAPGEESPFSYYFYLEADVTPDTYVVTITDSYTTDVARANVAVENSQFVNDGSGTIYISGELVNQSDQWAKVDSLAGAVLDGEQLVVSADWSMNYSSLLAPAGDPDGLDRTPFSLSVADPGDQTPDYRVYVDASLADAPEDYDLSIEGTYAYFDEYGDLHIVGTLTNNTQETLTSLVMAGLYDVDGVVLDADYSFLPVSMMPGEMIPWDVAYFSSVNYNDNEAARVDTYTYQVDWYSTYVTSSEIVSLQSSGDKNLSTGSTITYSGTVTNTSGKSLSSITVVVYVKNSDGLIIATGDTYAYPAENATVIAPNEAVTYELNLYMDPDLPAGGTYEFHTIVRGDVSQ